MSATSRPQQAESLFLLKDSVSKHAILWAMAAVGLFGFAMLGFVLAIVSDMDQFQMHTITTLPCILGVGAAGRAWNLFRTPTQIAVGEEGITIAGKSSRRTIAWEEMGWAKVETSGMSHTKLLKIYDHRGKLLTQLSEAIDEFPIFAKMVTERLASHPQEVAKAARKNVTRKGAWLSLAFGAFMALLGAAAIVMTYVEREADQRLQTKGILGTAEIVRRYTAPNGTTRRLEYRVTNEEGQSGLRNAEITPDVWKNLEGVTVAPVIYVPDEPENSRLLIGEVVENDATENPFIRFAMGALLCCLGLGGLTVGVLQSFGFDIDLALKSQK